MFEICNSHKSHCCCLLATKHPFCQQPRATFFVLHKLKARIPFQVFLCELMQDEAGRWKRCVGLLLFTLFIMLNFLFGLVDSISSVFFGYFLSSCRRLVSLHIFCCCCCVDCCCCCREFSQLILYFRIFSE